MNFTPVYLVSALVHEVTTHSDVDLAQELKTNCDGVALTASEKGGNESRTSHVLSCLVLASLLRT